MSHTAERLAALSLAAATAIGAVMLGWIVSGQVEARAVARIERTLMAAGHDWATVSGDGLRATLSGAAPDQAALDDAASAAATALPFVTVTLDASIVAPPPAPVADADSPFALDILCDEGSVALGGLAPDAASRAALVAALTQAGHGTAPIDFAQDAGQEPPGSWAVMEAAAVAVSRALLHGRIALAPDAVTITGLPRDDAARRIIARQAEILTGAGLDVSVDLVAPAVAEDEPYEFVVERLADRSRVLACTMPTARAAAAVRAKAGAMLGAFGVRCRVQSPAPDPGWVQAVEAGLAALSGTPGGRFELQGVSARLIPAPDAIGSAFDQAAGTLRAALPASFSLLAAPPDSGGESAPVASPALWFRSRLADDMLTLTGTVPDPVTRTTILSYAAAAFGVDQVVDEMEMAAGGAVEGWRTAVLAGIDALGPLDRGETVVIDGRLRLWGSTTDPSRLRVTQEALVPVQEAGWMATSRVTVDLPARVAAQLRGPQRCIDELTAIVQAEPILFEPASAAIDGDSRRVLDALAASLQGCEPVHIEVGGHTDSQGSRDFNERLSAARAASVRAALVDRGIGVELLEARGYGPSEPVADNATETGRALNRRITFRLLPPALSGAAPAIDPRVTPADMVVGASPEAAAAPPVVPVPRPENRP